MGRLIDASVFIDLERKGSHVSDLGEWLPDEPAMMAAMSASELLVGMHRAGTPQRREERKAFIDDVLKFATILPFDLDVARRHAVLWAELSGAGQLIGAHDLIIAATALAHDHSVLTLNMRDFDRVPGLTVIKPDW
jgi:tRNA(fMet)-specific endonuclease VapC